ncbi:hypothetical protein CTI12_AA542320 [Artemisia annua]|uniref:Glycosyl hydrolase family 32 C-terminal domain-containing protein n=1 Tax=Artemisia annua TaxID=35608 RepID=A0A2U1L138_ARTAN|nr:hypothetical protein CTI12_AA542320 [Artemisia annua]
MNQGEITNINSTAGLSKSKAIGTELKKHFLHICEFTNHQVAQVLRVLDYSETSRHLLVTAGDHVSLHLWDTTGRYTKIDHSVIESFGGGEKTCITTRVYPTLAIESCSY